VTQLAGVVLCGGASVRMGTEKALLEMDGELLVSRVAGRLASVADPVLLAPGRPGRLCLDLEYPELADERPGAGPLAGVAAALAASPHPLVAVVAVDMPFASPAVFELLAELHSGEDAVVPVTASGREPLHAVYSTRCLPAAREALAAGRLGMRALLDRLEVRDVGSPEWRAADPTGRFALNVNTAADLVHPS